MSGPVIFEHPHRGHLVRLEVTNFKGRDFANLRKWYASTDGWKPTREGCTIPLEQLGRLTAALMAYHGLDVPDGLETGS
jgi:hypothetical protein